MGVYNNTTITSTSPSDRIESLVNYLDAFDDISVELIEDYEYSSNTYIGALVSINGTDIKAFFAEKDNDSNAVLVYIKNGDSYLVNETYNSSETYPNLYVDIYIDDRAIILGIYQHSNNGIMLEYIKTINDKWLIGYGVKTQFADISTLTFEEVSDAARIPYSYANMFQYAAFDGTLDFLAQAYFVNANNYKSFTSDLLKACSTVSLMATVSMPSPLNNHLAIGAHCAVPLDDQ